MSADPGCGKSVLIKHLVDHILPNTSERTSCYFFFKDDFTDQKTATNALYAILRQLFMARPHLLHDSILDKFDIDGDKFIQSFHDLWSTLTTVAADQSAGEIVCILDALDECQDNDRLQLIHAATFKDLSILRRIKISYRKRSNSPLNTLARVRRASRVGSPGRHSQHQKELYTRLGRIQNDQKERE